MTTDKKLLIVYSNLGLGGIPVKIVDIVNKLGKQHANLAIHILLKKHKNFNLRSLIINPNITVSVFNSKNQNKSSLLFILWVWKFLLTYKPNTILTFISAYSLPILITKVLFFWTNPIMVVSEDSYTSTMINYMALPIIQRLGIRMLYPLASRIITPTRAINKDLKDSFSIPSEKIVTVPNWSRYALCPISKTKRACDIVYVGRIETIKNIPSMLNMLAMIIQKFNNRLSCYFVGEGSDVSRCSQFIKSNKLTKNIKIYPSTNDVSPYLYNAKILLFNPNRKLEGFPISILDAMSCGTIVLTKYFFGVSEVITNNKNGFIVNSDKDMKNRLLFIVKNYRSLLPIIKFAKKTVSNYNSLNNIQKYISCFDV